MLEKQKLCKDYMHDLQKRGKAMKIVILKDMDDDSVLRILSCADDVDTDALAKDILEKEYEIDGEIRDIDEVCSELQSKYSFETVKNFKSYSVQTLGKEKK